MIIHLNPIWPLLAIVRFESQLPEKSFPSRSRGWFGLYIVSLVFSVFPSNLAQKKGRRDTSCWYFRLSGHQRKLTLTRTVIQIFGPCCYFCLLSAEFSFENLFTDAFVFSTFRLQFERIEQRRSGQDDCYRSTFTSQAARYVCS